MEKLFVTHKIAKSAYERGFDEICFGWYYKDNTGNIQFLLTEETINMDELKKLDYPAPTYQQLLDWLRDQHQFYIYVFPTDDDRFMYTVSLKPSIKNRINQHYIDENYTFDYETYYMALERAVDWILPFITPVKQ